MSSPAEPFFLRRRFLGLIGGGAASLALPLPPLVLGGCGNGSGATHRFFTPAERATLEALVDRIFPADHDPGALALGAVSYIERLLTAFEGADPPRIYAGGPLSGRQPFADPATSVTDADGRFHDLDDLWAADGSLLPTSSGWNPTLTIIAVALEVGHGIAASVVGFTRRRDASVAGA